MKKEIKVHHIDSEEDRINETIKDVFTRKEIETNLNAPESNEKEEKVTHIDTDTKTVAIMILSVILIAFIAGWFIRDHGLSDNIENIQYQNKNIFIQNRIIENAEKSISGSLDQIESSKFILKEKYRVQYQ